MKRKIITEPLKKMMHKGCFYLLLVLFSTNLSAQITVDVKNQSLKEVLKVIETKSEYRFFYNEGLRGLDKVTSLQVNNASIEQTMSSLLTNTDIDYKLDKKHLIVLVEKVKSNESEVRKISGLIKETNGEPIIGASVLVKGTNKATITDTGGNFSLMVEPHSMLTISYIGHTPKAVQVLDQSPLIIVLEEESKDLKEVVVVGYGTQQKRFVTGSVSKVGSKELANYSGSNFAQQMSGKAAGVVINETSAQPGTDPQVVIRGMGTLTAGKSPLIVVDGFPLSEGSSMNSINTTDIETLDILKDPASAAIYGSRAANGVILITTKKRKSDKTTISVDVYSGFQQENNTVKFVNAYDAATFFTEGRDNGYVSLNPTLNKITDDRATRIAHGAGLRQLRMNYLQPYLDKTLGLTNTNWTDVVFINAPISSYNIALSGGTNKTNYYVSGNYFDQQGIAIGSGLKKYSGTLKLDSKMSDKFDFGISMNPSYNMQNLFTNNGDNSLDYVSYIAIMFPFFSPYNADGSLAISQQIKANTPEDGALGENVVAAAKMNINIKNTFRTFGNAYFNYRLVKDLKFKFLLGGDYTNVYQNTFFPSGVGAYRTPAPKPATAQEVDGFVSNYLVENTLTYSKIVGSHDFNILAGYSFQKENASTTIISGTNIPDDNISNINGASAFTANSAKYQWVQISYFGRLQYNYNHRYIASLTIRSDGSSRFGANNKWGYFPSATAGWIVSDEKFFPKNKVLTFTKLRATWGKTGNNQIGNYGSYALVTGGANSNYTFVNSLASGFSAATTPNSNLTWETKVSTNLGLDMTFFDKLNLTAEYYMSQTKDLLLNVPVPEQSGYSTALQNIGKVQNNGLELEASANSINLGQVKWNVNANIAFNNNKVLALAPGQIQIISGGESNIITKVGEPIAELYGYKITGIYKTQAEIAADGEKVLAGTKTGDYKVEDTNDDGVIDSKDRVPLGTYAPKFTYGFNSSFSYKNFDFSFSLTGVEGRKIYDRMLSGRVEVGESFGMPSQYYFDNRYDPIDNPNGTLAMPTSILTAARTATKASNFSIKDASYLRVRNIQLAYNIDEKLLKTLHVTTARIYVTANNLFTATKYQGYNPDGTDLGNSVLNGGQASYNYPVPRSYIVGLNITL